jgi:hypothetical protein
MATIFGKLREHEEAFIIALQRRYDAWSGGDAKAEATGM